MTTRWWITTQLLLMCALLAVACGACPRRRPC